MHRFTARYVDALAFAAELHQDQRRKHADVPYVSHLLAVSALVWEDGGDEVEATAALLHDAIEDQSDKVDVATIGRRFGADVAGIVMACTDALGLHDAPKPPWVHRKAEHLRHLADAPLPALRVTAADKLHNVRSLLDDRRTGTRDVWLRFNGRLHGTVWYYRQMAEILDDRLPPTVSRLPVLLADAVAQLEAYAAEDLASTPDTSWAAPEGWPPPALLRASA
ncbi:MAG: HD domain-containing protein [Acidimicrobiales bacterium]|nr:HD domain-containing protein [Acidimicrobiales bacterium]